MVLLVCEGLPIDIRVKDYRDVKGKLDRIVCVETMEHKQIGRLKFREFLKQLHTY